FEQLLPIAHQRPLDFHHDFVPGAAGLIRQPEFVGGTGASDIGQALIHQQQLAVIAMKIAHAPPPAQRVVPAQLYPRSQHALTLHGAQPRRAIGIEQTTHTNASLGCPAQGIDQALAAAAVLDQVQLDFHLLAGAVDGRQHPRKERRPVQQQLEAIAAAPGKDATARVHVQRAVKISTAPTGTERLIAGRSATLRSASMPPARAKSSACSTSGARATAWTRRSSRRVTSKSLSSSRLCSLRVSCRGRRNSSCAPGARSVNCARSTWALTRASGRREVSNNMARRR